MTSSTIESPLPNSIPRSAPLSNSAARLNTPRRDEGIDVTRSIAILGMFVIHAVLVLATGYPRSGPMAFVLWLCDGRAAATFVTLAGFGVARLASKTPSASVGATLRRRALILWGMGVLNLIIWPGDILRVYGVALLLAPFMLRWSIRARLALAVALVLLFTFGMVVFDWTKHWDLATLTYVGVWTPAGFVRNLFFDGFRPVVPWLSFFLVGTVIAEWDLHRVAIQRRLVGFGLAATLTALGVSLSLDRVLVRTAPQIDALTREGLVGTTSLPPLPLFMLSAMGTTSLLLGAVLLLVRVAPRRMVDALAATGRRALTWYLLHVMVLVSLYATPTRNALSAEAAVLVGVALFVVAVTWSGTHDATVGLFERIMRRLSSGLSDSPPAISWSRTLTPQSVHSASREDRGVTERD
jgi:uncharacterized protein